MCRMAVIEAYVEISRSKGRKLAWQWVWRENTKGTAQLRSFFVKVDERGWSWVMLVRGHSDLRIEAMCVGRAKDENMSLLCTLHEEDEEIKHSQHDDQ